MVEEDVLWKNWDQSLLAHNMVEQGLLVGLEVLYGSDNWPLAKRYFERSRYVLREIEEQNKLSDLPPHFPRNRGVLNRSKIFVDTLLGEKWSKELLLSVSIDFEDHCRARKPRKEDWDSQIQYYYINAVHFSLLGNNHTRAQQLITNCPYPLDSHKEHVSLLEAIIEAAKSKPRQSEQDIFLARYSDFFNKIRNPLWKNPRDYFIDEIGHVELALLDQLYIKAPGKDINWQAAINEYSK